MRTRARERIICLSGQYPGSAPRWRRWRGPRRRSPIWPCSRWGFPCPADCAAGGGLLPRRFTLAALRRRSGGGLIFCGTFRRPRLSPRLPAYIQRPAWLAPAATGYAASRPVEFGLSSPGARERAGSDSPPFQNRRDDSRPPAAIQGDGASCRNKPVASILPGVIPQGAPRTGSRPRRSSLLRIVDRATPSQWAALL